MTQYRNIGTKYNSIHTHSRIMKVVISVQKVKPRVFVSPIKEKKWRREQTREKRPLEDEPVFACRRVKSIKYSRRSVWSYTYNIYTSYYNAGVYIGVYQLVYILENDSEIPLTPTSLFLICWQWFSGFRSESHFGDTQLRRLDLCGYIIFLWVKWFLVRRAIGNKNLVKQNL